MKGTLAKVQPFVPLGGLAVAGAVIVALILTIASNSVFGLDFFHVFAGTLWISTDLFMGFIIGPIMNRLDIPACMVFAKKLMTTMMVAMPIVVITILLCAGGCGKVVGSTTDTPEASTSPTTPSMPPVVSTIPGHAITVQDAQTLLDSGSNTAFFLDVRTQVD